MAPTRQYAVLGPLLSGSEARAFLGCEVVDGAPRPDLPITISWLPDDVTRDAKQVARLQRETALVTQIRHPNVVRVHGLECFEEGWARVVAFADGESLARVLELARGLGLRVEPRVAVRIIDDACQGVQHVHEEGQARYAGRPIVHGNLRPDALVLTHDGTTLVSGYGATASAPTQHGGTKQEKYAYLAPEQIIGGKATASPATDIYALGAILYTLLSGKAPYQTAPDIERAVLTGEPPSIEEGGLLGRLGNVAATAMAKRGSDRFESVAVMREALDKALTGETPATREQVAEWLAVLVPPDAQERVAKKDLLASAVDIDSVTVLSRPAQAPDGMDSALFEAARPGPVSTAASRPLDPAEFEAEIVRTPRAREEKTVIDETLKQRAEAQPVALDDFAQAPPTLVTAAPMDPAQGVALRDPAEDEETEAAVPVVRPPIAAPSIALDAVMAGAKKAEPTEGVDPWPIARAEPPAAERPEASKEPEAQVRPSAFPSFPAAQGTGDLAPFPVTIKPQSIQPAAPRALATGPGGQAGAPVPSAMAAAAGPSAMAAGSPVPAAMGSGGPQQGLAPQGMMVQGPPGTMVQGPPGMMVQGPHGMVPQGPPGMMAQGPQGMMVPQGPPGMIVPGPHGMVPQGPPGMMVPGPHGMVPQGPPGMMPGPHSMGPQGPHGMMTPAGPGTMPPPGAFGGPRPAAQSAAGPYGTTPPGAPRAAPGNFLSQGPGGPPAMAPGSGVPSTMAQGPGGPSGMIPGPGGSPLSQGPAAMGARPQGASAGTQPPPGSARSNGQGAANNGALASALKGPAAVPRAPMREVSAITNFNVKAGDGSRATLIAVLLGVALAFVGIFYFTQAPPELSEEADESVRHKLPKDLVQQALNKPKTDEPAEAAEPGEPEAQVAAEPGATGATGTTEAPPPVVEKEGTAYVSSDPTVEVFLGSQSLGRTPVTAKLPVGPNKLRFTDKKTGINIYRTVRVKGGKEVREHFSFGTSELVVEAPEGAAILLNARFIGKAPLETIKIYEGSYHLKVTLDGKSWADTFDAPPGRRINYKVTLRD